MPNVSNLLGVTSGQGYGYQQTPVPLPPPATAPVSAYAGGTNKEKADRLRAAAKGRSEDLDRFGDNVLASWEKYYDAEASAKAGKPQYRSARGAPGLFDKPSECPSGMSPYGASDTAICLSNNDPRLYPGGRKGGGSDAAAAAAAAAAEAAAAKAAAPKTFGRSGDMGYTGNAMTDMLISQFNNRNQLGGTGSNIFGLQNGRTAGEWSDPTGQIAGNTPGTGTQKQSESAGKMLKGGGLWWTDDASKSKDVFGQAAPDATGTAGTDTTGLYNAQGQGSKSVAGMLANQYANTTTTNGQAQQYGY